MTTGSAFSRRALLVGCTASAVSFTLRQGSASARQYGAVIYGATPSGVMAAVAAAREGLDVAIVTAGPMGGMCAQGLGWTDASDRNVIGGLPLSFFTAVGSAYGQQKPAYLFEPHVAGRTFHTMLKSAGVTIITGYLSQVAKSGRRITAIRLTDGSVVNGRYFVDASYEGDLMAFSGCSFVVGRESQAAYGESFAGFNAYPKPGHGNFRDAHGNLIDGVKPFPNQAVGSGDAAVPAYTFRVCLTDDPANKKPFPKPASYDATRYTLALSTISSFAPGALPNHKFDLNGDHIGASWGWPNGTYAERSAIWQDHYNYQAGLLYFLANDPRVKSSLRDQVRHYGLPKDEFVSNGGWPEQLYIREARRLNGQIVLTQNIVQQGSVKIRSIGMGCYSFDAHPTQLLATGENELDYEGTIGPHAAAEVNPYRIPYGALMPNELDNLLVSVCVSATHVAYSSIRVEPQYMIMGEAAGCAVGLAAHGNEPTGAVATTISSKLAGYGAVVSLN